MNWYQVGLGYVVVAFAMVFMFGWITGRGRMAHNRLDLLMAAIWPVTFIGMLLWGVYQLGHRIGSTLPKVPR